VPRVLLRSLLKRKVVVSARLPLAQREGALSRYVERVLSRQHSDVLNRPKIPKVSQIRTGSPTIRVSSHYDEKPILFQQFRQRLQSFEWIFQMLEYIDQG